ncbi:hypothetical protein [Methylorubrum extorquens]|uniref:hypothetical protein n=1 Tax=Methylorubrum extorquens TaxID=408 RepID=UPI001EE52FB7|nr:hypothetical protein [Methylorubrum extorquens]MCG5248221.1 hypothetical protein [Methylorubrum extorquens]
MPQFYMMLRTYNALIVHFSGMPRGSGATAYYPNDLEYAVANTTATRLACSTVKPYDVFGPSQSSNATGSVGIILAPRTNASILDVWPTDAGSSRSRIVRYVTLQECEDTITQRVGYNEWAVTDYEVLGLFVMDPMQVVGFQKLPDGFGGTVDMPVPVDVDLTALPPVLSKLPVFTFSAGLIAKAVPHNDLYR